MMPINYVTGSYSIVFNKEAVIPGFFVLVYGAWIISGEAFLGISKDTKADFNSTNMKLSANWHPNKQLQKLWNKYGPECFELSVVKVLKYDDSHENHTAKLESLRGQCLAANSNARRLWK